MEKPLVVHIYRDMLRQANVYRQQMKKEIENKNEADHYADMSSELFFWCGKLEGTEAVNPTKK